MERFILALSSRIEYLKTMDKYVLNEQRREWIESSSNLRFNTEEKDVILSRVRSAASPMKVVWEGDTFVVIFPRYNDLPPKSREHLDLKGIVYTSFVSLGYNPALGTPTTSTKEE